MSLNQTPTPPDPAPGVVDVPAAASPPAAGGLRDTLLAWERLRVVYNAILLAAFVSVFGARERMSEMFTLTIMIQAVALAAVANILFFAGPLVELYLKTIGMRTPWARLTLFSLGAVYSVFLTMNTVGVLLGGRR